MTIKKLILVFCFMMCALCTVMGQSSVFTAMRNPSRAADERFEQGDYAGAVELYGTVLNKDPGNATAQVRVAQAHYELKEYAKAVKAYESCMKKKVTLKPKDLFQYAEAQCVLQNYPVALDYYRICHANDPDNEMISKKIWRLTNFEFLYEDSAHYSVRRVAGINTSASELCPIPIKNGIVFSSNRKGDRPMDQANGKATAQFYDLYAVEWNTHSKLRPYTPASAATTLSQTLESPFNTGPAAFFNNGTQMVFVSSARKATSEGYRPLGLYFARIKDGKWVFERAYALNGADYSIADVTINNEGNTMYFSSDMKGGKGGKDIYRSKLINGEWRGPWNLGEPINTTGDETFPYLHRNGTLYFSSNGHPGMGAIDIFKSAILPDGLTEPINVGYPLNSSQDDFGLSFDSLATHGYFTSNRAHGGYDDDIYEFDIALQTYPLVISGTLRYKEHTWSNSKDTRAWPNVKMALIDTWRAVSVGETVSDAAGTFNFSIPYHSRYHILIVDENGVEYKASLELKEQRTEINGHEIVVVKEVFHRPKDGG